MPRYRERKTKHKTRGMFVYSSREVIMPEKDKRELYEKIDKKLAEYKRFNQKQNSL